MVDVAKHVAYWVRGSREAMRLSEVALAAESSEFALFLAHLAIEKALKAHVTAQVNDVPPYTHNLPRLVALGALQLSAEEASFVKSMNQFCVAGRYPEEDEDEEPVSLDEAKEMVVRTRRLLEWLIERL